MLLVVAVTVLLGIGATQIEFATGQDSYLNSDSQIAIDNREFQDLFGGEAVILLFSATDPDADISDLFVGDNLAKLEAINADLAGIDEVESVVSPYTSLTFSEALIGVESSGRPPTRCSARRRATRPAPRPATQTPRSASLATRPIPEDRQIGNPAWNELLIFDNQGFTIDADGSPVAPADDQRHIRLSLASTFPNPQTAVGGVILLGNASLDEQSAGTEQILERLEDEQFDGFDLTVTGSPVYLKEINDYLQGGMLKLGGAAIVVMAIVLWLIFKVRWRLLPLLAVLLGVLWSFSLLGLIGIDLSLVTIAGLPILIGLGIDFAIQVHNRIEEEVLLDHDEHPISETHGQPRPAADRRHDHRRGRVPRAAHLEGADDPRLRRAARGRHRDARDRRHRRPRLGARRARAFKSRTGGEPKGLWVEHVVVKLGSLPVKVAPIIALVGVGPVRRRRARRVGHRDRERPDQVDQPGQRRRRGRRAARGRDRLLDHARDPRPGQQRLRPARDRPDLGLHARRRGPRRGRHLLEPGQHDGQDPDGPGGDTDRARARPTSTTRRR